ncbi:Sua5/YciO/YrdC/YwlC family protein [Halomonas piscis]|uniref:Threonylcarbamoyl-AMP synthase n=1 Tax=Halomonas piscis TaxID=3031727 RepID=A0ABY9Z3I4_9GAMM|nr:Sua5/YciO/YrdC/YwlC family protein [Halomonas piscis]WNK20839.1 Sua5/YciO/YrdC/YwlC family protein [Halomonas piscis]
MPTADRHSDTPDAAALARAADALRAGQVIACPTEAVWGLSCDPHSEAALAQLLRLKARDPAKGLIVVAASMAQLAPWLDGLDEALRAPLRASWPGPVTWLVPDNGTAPTLVRGEHDSVALRVTDHPGMQALCDAFGGPLVSTSANRTGEAPALTAEAAGAMFGEALGMVVPGRLGGYARPSQIRDLASGRVLRD